MIKLLKGFDIRVRIMSAEHKHHRFCGTVIGSYDGVFWFVQGAAGYESLATFEFRVLAWMPLPEPYREE